MSKYKDLTEVLEVGKSKYYDDDDVFDLKERIIELENIIEQAKDELLKYVDEDVVEEIFGE